MTTYGDFLAGKRVTVAASGFDAPPLLPALFPFQRQIVRWALRRGRAALFCDTGLGKTIMQLEWARRVAEHSGGRVLVLCPLAVAAQTCREAARFGIEAAHAREAGDAGAAPIVVANYERLHKFDTGAFAGVVLDESSILKAYMGPTKRRIIEAFRATPYRLACTATPAPNDHLELGNHADFLGVMDPHEMIARWFINDTSTFGTYRLKGHAVEAFWDWVASWAACVGAPSDLGYPDGDFKLPELAVEKHVISVDLTAERGDGELFRIPDMSATAVHRERRLTASARAAHAAALVAAEPDEPWIVWCETDYEAAALREAIPEATEVHGPQSMEAKERGLADFAEGRARVLVTKPAIAGHGLNWQHCARVIFACATFSYEQFYQAVRRSWRYGQKRPVRVHVLMGATETHIWSVLARKQGGHEAMKEEMFAAARRAQAQSAREGTYQPTATAPVPAWMAAGAPRVPVLDHAEGEGWMLYNADAVELVARLPDASVGFSLYSPPFSSLYTYSESERDMGNSATDAEFMEHYRFLVGHLLRVTKPGRLVAVHCKDLVNYKGRDGMAGLRDFPGEIVRAHTDAGFAYHSRVTVWKCPVTEMQRTKAHGLLYKQLRADSTFSRQGLAEYVLIFRRWAGEGEEVDPVTHTHESFPLDRWQEWASPVWMDIDQTNVLNVEQARADRDEKHMCPLQLDLIERCVRLWSNPGDVVLSPFAGIGSEGVVALRCGRRFVGVELKPEYFQHGARNLGGAVRQRELFARTA